MSKKRKLGIDYGEARVGIAITDALNITIQGLESIKRNDSDKVVLKRMDEILATYDVDTLVVGMPYNMDGTMSKRCEITKEFIHKLKCKYNGYEIVEVDERLTTVAAHKTMNYLDVNKRQKRNIVDTISAEYILEKYVNKLKNILQNDAK
ncbi:MAG: Holliday junction resolvase RuvX [Eubacteriales bacterium]